MFNLDLRPTALGVKEVVIRPEIGGMQFCMLPDEADQFANRLIEAARMARESINRRGNHAGR